MTLGYAFVGYSHRFRRRTCHTVRKLVHDKVNVDRQPSAMLKVRFPVELLKKLGVEGEWEGIGHCAVGYIDGEAPKAAKRKDNRVFWIE